MTHARVIVAPSFSIICSPTPQSSYFLMVVSKHGTDFNSIERKFMVRNSSLITDGALHLLLLITKMTRVID
jgi:hypothetical protein